MRTVTTGHYADILERIIVPDREASVALEHAIALLELEGYKVCFRFEERITLTKAPSEVAYVTVTDVTPSDFVPPTPRKLCHPY